MSPINKEPIEVDFNNLEEDGAVRLHLPVTQQRLKKEGLELSEGRKIWVTDNEIEMIGTTTFRDGIWVAIPDKNSFKDVDENAPYHIKNMKS